MDFEILTSKFSTDFFNNFITRMLLLLGIKKVFFIINKEHF